MSSPVTKLRHFSRLYSLNSSHSTKALTSPHLTNTPEFPFLPDENIRHVDTPCSNKSPNLCSTPASGPFKQAYEGTLSQGQSSCSSLASTNFNSKSLRHELSMRNLNLNLPSKRKRCLGISETIATAKLKNKPVVELVHCNDAQGLSERASARERSRCNVFSTSVIPCASPCQAKAQIFRLSGLLMSPNSVSWSAESPIPVQSNASALAGRFTLNEMCNKANKDESRVLKARLQKPSEQCPPGKLYFWEESEEEIIAEEKVGKGGFGQVFKGMYRGEKVAIKKLEHAFKPRQAVLETLQGELQGLRFCHPNIVRTLVVIQTNPFFDIKSKQKSCYVVMEHAGSQNLSQIINNANENISEDRRYSNTNGILCDCKALQISKTTMEVFQEETFYPRKIRYLCDILSGLSYLHSNKLAHLDLKPSNVIVTPTDSCKICDFGSCSQVSTPKDTGSEMSSRESNVTASSDSAVSNSIFSGRTTSSASSAKSSSQLMGTYIYRAPELLRGYHPTVQADIFSFSITAWQVWSRRLPYSGQHNHAAVFAVVAFGARPVIPKLISLPNVTQIEKAQKIFFELLTLCWHADPCCRPNAEDALLSMNTCLSLII